MGQWKKWLNFGGDLDHCLDTEIVFRIHHYLEIRKVASTDCVARGYSAEHALAGIAIATMTSLRHRPTTDSHVSYSDGEWYRDTGKTCLGGGMHCPGDSNFLTVCVKLVHSGVSYLHDSSPQPIATICLQSFTNKYLLSRPTYTVCAIQRMTQNILKYSRAFAKMQERDRDLLRREKGLKQLWCIFTFLKSREHYNK